MATEAQITANRRNCQKSTGPRTTRGKTTVSQNALKHGLSAGQAVIDLEDQADFDLYRQQFLAELEPQTPMESMLAERIVNLSWRLIRAGRFQNQTIDALNTPAPPSPLTKLKESLLKDLKTSATPSKSTTDFPLGRLAIKDFSNDRILERLLMYERRIENSLYKTIVELQRINLIKNLSSEYAAPIKQFSSKNLKNQVHNYDPI
ncbi:MAG: hypothetical protein PVG93_01010 [Phycisphaerales bacterium]|jgi:hypothetical protein